MSLREDLGKAREAATLYDVHGVMPTWAKMAMADFLRDHGQELVEAVDADAKYREIARLIGSIFFYGGFKAETYNERALEKLIRETGNFYETEDEATASRSKPVDGGGVLEGIKKHRGNPENPPST